MAKPASIRACLGLGANLADKQAAIAEAVSRIAGSDGVRLIARSKDYRTPPWGKTDQDWFVNAALVIETELAPHALMERCLAIETAMGRERRDRWGPRRIDIDIIAYGDIRMDDDRLTLPHRHALERAFVLVPLAEIAPDLVLCGQNIRAALARLDRSEIVAIDDETSDAPHFDRAFPEAAGVVRQISPRVRRIIAPNPSPYTFTGTCTYIIGTGRVAVLDPGPNDPVHLQTIMDALKGEEVAQIVVTHTHRDHSPAAASLKGLTDAPILGCGPHRPARPLYPGEMEMEAGGDRSYRPDRIITDGERIEGDGYALTALHTPGHTANHLCFALEGEDVLFSGDHVMAWSTTVVAPPDGSMRDFMASLDLLKSRPEQLFLPGHGGPVKNPARFVRALIHHRRMREATIVNRIRAGDETIPALVATVYENLNPALIGGASMSILAHLEDLVARDVVRADGPPTLKARYVPGATG